MHLGVVVVDREIALDEVAVVLREEARALELVAGEGADVLERVEEEDGHELGAAAADAAEDERAAGAGQLPCRLHAAALEVVGVRLRVLGERRAAPDPRDHSPSRYCE